MFQNIIWLAITIYVIYVINRYSLRGMYMYDNRGRFIYYPATTKSGYVLDDKSKIDEVCKSFFKCVYFDVKGFRNDVKEIFKDCEVVNEPLPFNVRFKNIAKTYPWWVLLTNFVIGIYIVISSYFKLNVFFSIIFIPFLFITCKQMYYKLKADK